MIFNNEYKNYRYVVLKGYLDRSKEVACFIPTTCISMHNNKDSAIISKKECTAKIPKEEKKMGDVCRVVDTSTKNVSSEAIEVINAKFIKEQLQSIHECLDLDKKLNDLIVNAITKLVREDKELSFEELNNFSIEQVTYKTDASESISTYTHTSCWSHSLTGEWKTCNDRTLILNGWTCGNVNRV